MPNRDERRIALPPDRGVPFCLRRPAIELGATWGVGHGTGAVVQLEEGSRWTIPVQVHEPSNRMTASRPGGPSGRQRSSASSLLSDNEALRYRGASSRPGRAYWPGAVRRPSFPQRSAVHARMAAALDPARSRSAWTTRAEAAMSGSRMTVPTSQSTYEGSNAATWPSVWPWNLPNSRTCAEASSRLGGFGRRNPRTRSRTSGPFGSEARGVSRPAMSARSGGWPDSGDAAATGPSSASVAWPIRRARVDPSGHGPASASGPGGPPRRAGASSSNDVPSGRRPPSAVASPDRTSAA